VLQFAERTIRAWRNRRTAAKLTEFDDHILQDLGLNRSDVYDALDTPFSSDPSLELQRYALRNRARGWNL